MMACFLGNSANGLRAEYLQKRKILPLRQKQGPLHHKNTLADVGRRKTSCIGTTQAREFSHALQIFLAMPVVRSKSGPLRRSRETKSGRGGCQVGFFLARLMGRTFPPFGT